MIPETVRGGPVPLRREVRYYARSERGPLIDRPSLIVLRREVRYYARSEPG